MLPLQQFLDASLFLHSATDILRFLLCAFARDVITTQKLFWFSNGSKVEYFQMDLRCKNLKRLATIDKINFSSLV